MPACSSDTLTDVLPHRNAMPQTAYRFNLWDFCVDAEELQLTQRTDSSRINYSFIKSSGFVCADSARVIVCFYIVLDG